MANHAAVEQEHRHFEAELAGELRVGVDVDHGHGRNGMVSLEIRQLVKHLVTEPTSLAGDDDEALFQSRLLALGSQTHGRRRLLGLGRLDLLGEELDGGGRHLTHGRDLVAIDHGGERR
jgi:hypothetical protein